MAEVKYKFKGIARLNATLIFTALAASPLSVMTNGFLGKITFYFLEIAGNWLANQGLALANLGVDFIETHFQQKDFDESWDISEKIKNEILKTKSRLTKEEKEKIDAPVKDAFRKFAPFT